MFKLSNKWLKLTKKEFKVKPGNDLWLVFRRMLWLYKGHCPSFQKQCKHLQKILSEEALLYLWFQQSVVNGTTKILALNGFFLTYIYKVKSKRRLMKSNGRFHALSDEEAWFHGEFSLQWFGLYMQFSLLLPSHWSPSLYRNW